MARSARPHEAPDLDPADVKQALVWALQTCAVWERRRGDRGGDDVLDDARYLRSLVNLTRDHMEKRVLRRSGKERLTEGDISALALRAELASVIGCVRGELGGGSPASPVVGPRILAVLRRLGWTGNEASVLAAANAVETEWRKSVRGRATVDQAVERLVVAAGLLRASAYYAKKALFANAAELIDFRTITIQDLLIVVFEGVGLTHRMARQLAADDEDRIVRRKWRRVPRQRSPPPVDGAFVSEPRDQAQLPDGVDPDAHVDD